MGVNKVILVGNVGKDPEVRHLEGGASVATITLATSERYKDRNSGETKELTEWHTIVAWRQLADLAERFIRKGSQIYVEGKLRSRSWDDQNNQKRYVTEILADTIQLLGRRSDQAVPEGGAYDQGQAASRNVVREQKPTFTQPVANNDLTDEGADDLPF